MAENAERIANLKVELDNVKLRIEEIDDLSSLREKLVWKDTYNLLLKKEMGLKEDIKALEGLLFIVSPFTESLEIDQIVYKCR